MFHITNERLKLSLGVYAIAPNAQELGAKTSILPVLPFYNNMCLSVLIYLKLYNKVPYHKLDKTYF